MPNLHILGNVQPGTIVRVIKGQAIFNQYIELDPLNEDLIVGVMGSTVGHIIQCADPNGIKKEFPRLTKVEILHQPIESMIVHLRKYSDIPVESLALPFDVPSANLIVRITFKISEAVPGPYLNLEMTSQVNGSSTQFNQRQVHALPKPREHLRNEIYDWFSGLNLAFITTEEQDYLKGQIIPCLDRMKYHPIIMLLGHRILSD